MTETATTHKPGDKMDDGTVYAESLNGKAIYTTADDAPFTYSFNEAAEYAEQLNAERFFGHDDWRVPTPRELSLLFSNRAAIGGFDDTGYYPAGWYWSSSPFSDRAAWAQRFSGGEPLIYGRANDTSLRCVRG